jgi:membrane carboxypeptidase/penicillin-binding protein PbpC
VQPKTADEVGLSLALWTFEMSPLQFTHLWRSLLPAHVPEGYELQRRDVVDVLSNPVHKIVSFGQDNFLSPRGWAVKTWTSRKFVDGWICGTKDQTGGLSACLWLGNQTNESMLGASSEVGSYLWSLLVQAIQ